MDISSAIEAILFASGEAVSIERISEVLGADTKEILVSAKELSGEYIKGNRGIRLLQLDDKLQLCSAPEYHELIAGALEQRKPPRLSQASLEVLAIVAYFQPVTRSFIEQVRGIDSSNTVIALCEKGLIEACGKLEAPGRPSVYRTTDAFLRVFEISSLEDMPVLPDLTGNDNIERLKSRIKELESSECEGQISISDI